MLRLALPLCLVLSSCVFFAGAGGADIATDLLGLWVVRDYSDQTFADEELTEVVRTGRSFRLWELNFGVDDAEDPRDRRGFAEPRRAGGRLEFTWRVEVRDGQAVLRIRTVFPCTEFEIEKRAPVGGRDVYFLLCVMRTEDGDFRRVRFQLRRVA